MALCCVPGTWRTNVERLKEYIEKGGSPNDKGLFGRTPLHELAKFDYNLPKIKEYLKYGADPNVQDDYGMTPLHMAAKMDAVKVMKTFIQSSAKWEILDNNQNNFLKRIRNKNRRMEMEEYINEFYRLDIKEPDNEI